MTVKPVTPTPTPVPKPKPIEQSKALKAVEKARQLANETLSPVQKALRAKDAEIQKAADNNFFESEDYLRMSAFEIRNRITLYKNLGLTQQYEQAQAEGAEVVKKYQAILAKAQAGGGSVNKSA